jgi:hypothetical protein
MIEHTEKSEHCNEKHTRQTNQFRQHYKTTFLARAQRFRNTGVIDER